MLSLDQERQFPSSVGSGHLQIGRFRLINGTTSTMMKTISTLLAVLVLFAVPGFLQAHPVPDVPVRTVFEAGEATISVEVDVRCFSDDPEGEPYLVNRVLKASTDQEKKVYTDQAMALIESSIRFFLEPVGRIQPEFSFDFTGKNGASLEKDDDPVMITAKAKLGVPEGAGSYKIEASEAGKLSVVFLNTVDGKEVERIAVLFPGEKSYALDVSGIDRSESGEVKKKTTGKAAVTKKP